MSVHTQVDWRRRRILGTLILIVTVFGPSLLSAQTPLAAVPRLAASAGTAVSETETRSVRLLVGRSAIVDVGTPITRVSLTSADIADALVTAPGELLVNGKTPGTISMFVWDRAGAIRRFEIVVQRDLARLNEQIKLHFPAETIEARANGRDIVLSGTASTKDVMEKTISLAAGFVEKKDEVVSLLQLAPNGPSNQVLLRVRFAEVSRSAISSLGASIFTSPNGYKDFVGRSTTGQFPAPDFVERIGPASAANPNGEGKFTFSDFLNLFLFNTKYQIGTVIKALQTKGLFQSLAEPNLVAESGKEASFLAGGEFPIPVAQASGGGTTITIQYKEFGVRLNFTPIVSGNRVHLKVRPEVSTLDFANAITLQGFRIPALSTRRTETELELENGQTFAIAGLLNNTVNSSLQKVPGIGDVPVLGLLFKSKAAQKEQTELVVMITPEILPNGSNGLTGNLPRLIEPYLPPAPEKQTVTPPPPAFRSGPAAPPAATKQEQEAAARAQAAETKRLAKVADENRRKQEVDDKVNAKLAREQAERDARAAKKQAEIDKENAKKQAQADKAAAKKLTKGQ